MNFRTNERMNFGPRRHGEWYTPWLWVLLLGLLFVGLMSLHGCALFGQTAPQTANEKLIYAYAHTIAAEQEATALLTQKQISSATAQCVQAAAHGVHDTVKGYLQDVQDGKPVNAQQVLGLVQGDVNIVLQFADQKGGNLTCKR